MKALPLVSALAALALALPAGVSSAADPPRPEPGPDGDVAWVHAGLGPVPGRDVVHLHIMTLDRAVARVMVEPLGTCGVDASGLACADGAVKGRLVIGHEPRQMNRTLVPRLATRMALTLDLTLADGRVSGTFGGEWPDAKSVEKPVAVSGTVNGTVLDEAALRKRHGLAPDAAWPGWLGPNQNFSSGPCDAPLVDDLASARLVWAGPWIGPTESGSQRYGACVGCPPAAGGASPLVWKGRVYQFRHAASGDAVQEAHLAKVLEGEKGKETRAKLEAVGWTEADLRRRWAVRADEQLVCLDAATGRTRWTVTWPGEGVNLYDHKCSLTNHTGAVADGRVFVFGAMGVVRCVDAETGEARWAAEVPGYADAMKGFLAKCLETRNVAAPTRSFCHGLNVAGGTVVAPDGPGACGVVGLDAASGKVLWRVEKVLGKAATPMAWRKDGTDYVLAANADGVIACIEARTGRVAWRHDGAGDNEYQTLLVGDLLIGHAMKAEARKAAPRAPDDGPHSAPGENYGQVACWRLTADGPERVWAAPAEWGAPSNSPLGSAAGGLVCFRGNYSYHLVRPESGERIASLHLPVPVRWDEGHLLALSGAFVLHPDSQHGQTKLFLLPARADGQVGPLWQPPHPGATTYQSAMSHAWADGRLFIRGADTVYCYDLRKEP